MAKKEDVKKEDVKQEDNNIQLPFAGAAPLLIVDNMNIYQKLAVLQSKITVNKDKRNTFADFNYRTIQDILAELKPVLTELSLMIRFGSGKLDGDKYTLDIIITDINNPVAQIEETGEIYLDRTKSKMDLSQKVLSAKTFLKKSLLEDLLLISEDVDPDSHDNTGLQGDNFRSSTTPTNKGNTSNGDAQTAKNRGNNQGNTTSNQTKDIETMKIDTILSLAESSKLGNKADLLKAATTFDKFKGYTDVDKVSIKVKTNLLKVVTADQVARLMTIAGNKDITDDDIKTFIGKVWGKLSKTDLHVLEYDILCGYLQTKPDKKK